MKRTYTTTEATDIAEKLGLDFKKREFDLEQFRAGLNVEAEHGAATPETNVTDDDPVATGKIALAHLNEIPDYYTRLAKMEAEGEAALAARKKAAKRGLVARIIPLVILAAVFLALKARAKRRAEEGGVAESAAASWAEGASAR